MVTLHISDILIPEVGQTFLPDAFDGNRTEVSVKSATINTLSEEVEFVTLVKDGCDAEVEVPSMDLMVDSEIYDIEDEPIDRDYIDFISICESIKKKYGCNAYFKARQGDFYYIAEDHKIHIETDIENSDAPFILTTSDGEDYDITIPCLEQSKD